MLWKIECMSIFSVAVSLWEYAWRFIGWVLEILWKLVTGSLHMGFKLVTGVADLLLRPFSWGIDRLWDVGVQGGQGLWSVFGWVLSALLTACLLIALLAVAGNAYRRFRHR